MLNLRCLLLAIAAGAAVSPAALAYADDGFSDDGLTLTSAGPHVPYTTLGPDGYVGFQPLFTEWQQYQPTNVVIDGTTVGTYNVFETDYATPWSDQSVYIFGSATSGGTDPGGLAGATVTDYALFPSFNEATEQRPPADVTAALHDIHAVLGNGEVDNLLTTASGTYLSVDDPGVGSALWFEAPGSTDATLIWSGLADTAKELATVEHLSNLLPPDVWWPGI
ncbi:hypothetical protein [Mycobacterium sp. 1245111.1]|uniref:hypothetical protein n=1 Tax=Mycobacterium sp. 1245111.1 TaxID=1834073 RepID=UPI000AA97809|nr:hypothetical protein [Mycobacterium sp. 1245111.1]